MIGEIEMLLYFFSTKMKQQNKVTSKNQENTWSGWWIKTV